MTKQESLTLVVNDNFSFLISIVNSICLYKNITKKEFYNSPKFYLESYINSIKNENLKIASLRSRRLKLNQDLDDLERAYCDADKYDKDRKSFNNGFKENKVEIRQIEKKKIREKIQDLLIQTMELESNIEVKNKNLETLFNLIPNQVSGMILTLLFIDNFSTFEISRVKNYSYDYIRVCKLRGITDLVNIFKKML